MPTVKFIKDGKVVKEVYVAPGANLRQAAMTNGVPVHHDMTPLSTKIVQVMNCHGLGACATCLVHVKQGMENLSPKSIMEKIRLPLSFAVIGNEDKARLACQTKVNGDCEIEVQPAFNLSGEKFWEHKSPSFSAAKAE